ncbi:MAG: hypothetical protein ACM32O_09120 [Clostridia bacterium]
MTVTMATGYDLVEKWIEKNTGVMSKDEMNGMVFVFGDAAYRVEKRADGSLGIGLISEKVVVFRDFKQIEDEHMCRICGTHYKNKIDTIRCCMNQDE